MKWIILVQIVNTGRANGDSRLIGTGNSYTITGDDASKTIYVLAGDMKRLEIVQLMQPHMKYMKILGQHMTLSRLLIGKI